MKRFFKWLLLLVAVIAVGMTIFLYNPGLVKGPLERYLSNLAGFSITVEGELHIETGRVTELSADNIRIAAPEWSTRTDLVTINQLRLSLDITTVFDDIVVVSFLQIDDLQLNLEVRADGTNNWTRTDNLPSGAEGRTTHPVIVFDTVQVTNTLARYKDDKRGREQVLYIETLNQIHEPGGSLSINLDGS